MKTNSVRSAGLVNIENLTAPRSELREPAVRGTHHAPPPDPDRRRDARLSAAQPCLGGLLWGSPHTDVQFAQLRVTHEARRVGEQARGLLGLGEGDHVADGFGRDVADAVGTERTPPLS